MKITFNPSTVAALTTPPNNKDITFDLKGHNIFARGVKFYGTDTNTWRDIKINNVSIGSNVLDLRNGTNTTLTNTNGVVTISSTWRPIVDNLTSTSTTSSLSANQGRVLKALIDGKSDSGHNHDNRYLKLTGGTLSGTLAISTSNFGGLIIQRNDATNGAAIQFKGSSNVYGYIGFNNASKNAQLLRWNSAADAAFSILDTSTTYVKSNKGYINGTEITQVNNANNATNSTNANRLSSNTEFALGNNFLQYFNTSGLESSGINNAAPNKDWWHIIRMNHPNSKGYFSELAIALNSYNGVYWRTINAGREAKSWTRLANIGDLAWDNITGKPSSFTPSAHTHAWNSLTHSSTTENQAILTNGKANGWKLYTLNISGWNNAANNAHSHSNKSVLDGITSALVSSWNTAYTFVDTITKTDTDKVINKWSEIVNFLSGIDSSNKLNTLLNSKLSVYELADKTNVGAIKNNGIYYSTSDASSGTLTNSPFNTGFALINMTSYDGGDDLRRSRLAFNAYGEVKVSNDRGAASTAETWYQVLTSHNTYISNGSGIINGTTITQVSNADTTDGVHLEWSGELTYDQYSWLAAWTNDGKKIKTVKKSQFATAGHTHDDRYYTESEVNNLLAKKLDRVNLSIGTWNPRNYSLAADYQYGGGDISLSVDSSRQMHVSVDGYFWQNEGKYRTLDTSDIAELKGNLTVNQYLSSTDAAWWPLIWGGSSHNNTSNSTGAVYKSYDKLSWQTSTQTLYATRMRTTSVDLNDNRGIFQVVAGGTSPYKGIKLPTLQSNGIGMFSRFSNSTDEGGIIISEDTCIIYNSFDTGWGLSVRDKDLNQTDISTDATVAFGVDQNHKVYSLGGFTKNGSSDSYVLLGGGGHKAESALNVANADTVDGYHATSGRTFNGDINWSGNWNDAWSDGTNKHPWYGFDHRYPNTGAYSTTISDYFGMTIKTQWTLRLDFGTLLLNGTSIYDIKIPWSNVTGKPTMPSNITATKAQIVTISGSTVTVNASLDAYKTPGEFNIFGTSNGDYAKMYVQSGIGDAFNGTRVITQTIKVTISHNTYAEVCDVTRQYKSNAWSKWTVMYLGND